jgi:A/G-specific adenine glycosylase
MNKHAFSKKLIAWYLQHKRDLPWRETSDPYTIWVSEVIMQQTRIDQGIGYFYRFMEAFPDVSALASAPHDQVMHIWQGLGYYSRARNMHHAAKQIVLDHGGVFPSAYQDILRLKGVGTYTAAAIASIAFSAPYAVIDGNVFRFLARYFAIATPINSTSGKKEFAELASGLLYLDDPGTFNQAMMEFGALVCRPVNPSCESCPFKHPCLARAAGLEKQLPVKDARPRIRERYLHFMIYRDVQGRTLLMKREGRDIWEGLYQFPMVESANLDFVPEHLFPVIGVSHFIKHQLTHQRIFARFWHFETENLPAIPGTVRVSYNELGRYALPRIISRYLENPVVNW